MRNLILTGRLCATVLIFVCCRGVAIAQPASETPAPETLTLQQALDLAQRNNRQLRIARMQVGQAQQAAAATRTQLLPQVNVQATGGQLLDPVTAHFPKGILGEVNGTPIPTQDLNISTGDRFTALYSITVAQPLTQIPRIRAGIRAQDVGIDIAREGQRQQRQTISSEVRHVYYAIQQTQAGIAAAGEGLLALQELERTVANDVAQQAALRADLLDVQARRAQQEAMLLTLRDTQQQYKEQMNVLLGRDIQTPFQLAPEAEPLPLEADSGQLQAQALRDRPDLRRTALQIQQAELDRHSTQLQYIPDISLAMSYYGLGGGLNGLPDHLWTLGFQASWAPLDWGQRRHEIAAKTEVVEQARATYEEAQAQAQVDVNNQLRRQREARERVRAAHAAQDAARERLRVTMNQYRVKAALLKDVLQAQAALADADRQVQEAALSYLTAQSDLRKAIGAE